MLLYQEPVFRPPSEANSVIIQATIGCSWNRCAFCDMYKQKSFSFKNIAQLTHHIQVLSGFYPSASRIFIGDGDALAMPVELLAETLKLIKQYFPSVKTITCYASARNILNKSMDELQLLRSLQLRTLFIGIESGSNKVLEINSKGISSEEQTIAMQKAKEAGFKRSVMILSGLGGQQYSTLHAIETARWLNINQPEQLSLLTLSFPFGIEHYIRRLSSEFSPLNPVETIEEVRMMIESSCLNSTLFRSDHNSNNLILNGALPKDKKLFLRLIDEALLYPDAIISRAHSARML